jgi:SAM-dependent methyltransferase
VREQRLVFGEDAARYDRARPSYPPELIADVVDFVGLPARAVDAGCGTGRAAALLAGRGVDGVGVEADPAMGSLARANLASAPGWRVDVSGFEEWRPAGGRPFDLVVSAQAWHWIDPDRRMQQAAALLRPGGWLAVWWNRPDLDESELRVAIDAVYSERAPELPPRGMASLPVPEDVDGSAAFDSHLVREYRWSKDYSSAAWIDLLQTHSDHRMMDPQRRTLLLDEIARAIDEHGGVYRHHYVCRLRAARRTSAAS